MKQLIAIMLILSYNEYLEFGLSNCNQNQKVIKFYNNLMHNQIVKLKKKKKYKITFSLSYNMFWNTLYAREVYSF